MTTIFDVAKYILEKQSTMSTWKLQKLCYYSQAWTLAWDNVSLFDEEFEAWANGPVSPQLFEKHRGKYMIDASALPCGDSANLSEEQKDNINIVLAHYGDKEAYWLREQTHSEAPWKDARGSLPDGVPSSALITKEAIGEYYGSL